LIDEPDRRSVVVLAITAERKVRAPQGMMPGNSRAPSGRLPVVGRGQIAQQKVYRRASGKGEMAG